jgi:subtilisin-like proprotein convertase family protein
MATSTVRAALEAATLDIENPGRDRNTGQGLLLAGEALAAVGAQAQAYPQVEEPLVTQSSDGDLFLEPGETGTVDVPITNNGDGKALLVTADLSSGAAGVVISPSNNYYGNIPVGETATRSFSVTVPVTTQPGSAVTLTTTVSFAGGYSPLTTDSRLVVGEPSTESVEARYTGAPVAIPDNNPTGVSVPLTFSGVGPVSGGVTFSIDGTECNATANSTTVGISHTYIRDLIGTLTAPDGTAVRLFERTGGSGNNLCQVRLLDSATKPIQGAIANDNPYTGDWLPAQPLNALRGTQADGTWQFTVADLALADTGAIRSVSMTVRGYVANAPVAAG